MDGKSVPDRRREEQKCMIVQMNTIKGMKIQGIAASCRIRWRIYVLIRARIPSPQELNFSAGRARARVERIRIRKQKESRYLPTSCFAASPLVEKGKNRFLSFAERRCADGKLILKASF
jgi:hypothetical protein